MSVKATLDRAGFPRLRLGGELLQDHTLYRQRFFIVKSNGQQQEVKSVLQFFVEGWEWAVVGVGPGIFVFAEAVGQT